MQCPACAADVPDDDLFCESCGVALRAAAAAPAVVQPGCACGASADEVDEDGFCLRCGLRARRALPWDHVEQVVSGNFAALSDRGLKHERNEDRVAIAEVQGAYVMVVCDGVSNTRESEIASGAVSEGVLAALTEALTGRMLGPGFDAVTAMRQAIRAGAAKLAAQGSSAGDGTAPSTTVVAALVTGKDAVVAWMGDSRAYWMDGAGARALTRDHSWMNEVVAEGVLSAEQAAAAPQAHAITRWIGADASEAAEPEILRVPLGGAGMLLLCTDGLWNYAARDEDIDKLLRENAGAGEAAVDVARRVVKFAMGCGGHDNITAAVLRLGSMKDAPHTMACEGESSDGR